MRFLFFIFYFLLASFDSYSTKYVAPLECTMVLTSGYGEARPNHFHSGIDIRTAYREGLTVRSIADGYISRIAVSGGGYGRAIYVSHFDGRTSVYAHLKCFTPEVEKYISDERYRSRKHTINIFPPSDRFRVKAGQTIGLGGNSGMSFGPHLHFEIRETASQKSLNPIIVGGFDIPDSVKPSFINVMYVAVDTLNGVVIRSKPMNIPLVRSTNGVYRAVSKQPTIVGTNGYFMVQVADSKNGAGSTNMAISKVEQRFNDTVSFSFVIREFLFSDTRYVNAVTDYEIQKTTRNDIYILARKEGNRMPIYGDFSDNGVLKLSKGEECSVSIEIVDDAGNQSYLSMVVVGGDYPKAEMPTQRVLIARYDKPFFYSSNGATLSIPKGGLYESIFYNQKVSNIKPLVKKLSLLSPLYDIHTSQVPLHSYSPLTIMCDVPKHLQDRVAVASVDSDGELSFVRAKYDVDKVNSRIREFGTYCVVADTIPPTIRSSFGSGSDLRNRSEITFIVDDNFSGISTFEATIDGEWILFEQMIVQNKIIHTFDDKRTLRTGGRHKLRLEVVDGCGNKSVIERWFIR